MTPFPALLPRPTRLEQTDDSFVLDEETVIAAPRALRQVAVQLQGMLRPATGLPLPAVETADGAPGPASAASASAASAFGAEAGAASDGSPRGRHAAAPAADPDIRLALDDALAPEAYRLTVAADGVEIVGGDAAGVYHGCQSLRQLLPAAVFRRARVAGCTWALPGALIEDAPAFGWRGMMLDVGRHFMPKHDVLRLIDLMAAHKLNVFHFHLTEDQGWRIEIRRYPELTRAGAWRPSSQVGAGDDAGQDGRPHGGFYTQDDIREIVAYARERFITVVPEIETPGHAQAAIAAYPELGVTGERLQPWTKWGVNENVFNVEESTIEFVTNVLDEVMELFDSEYIGVGGDECPKTQWANDPRTQERMRELGVASEEELQSWFIGRLDAHLAAAGRKLFGWDEILEGGLAEGATVASWRGMTGAIAAARAGHDVVACPVDRVYLDYRQSDDPAEPIPVAMVLTPEDVYAFDPVPAELTAEQAKHVLGGQANVWTEYMDSPRTVDYFVFPRLCALAEVLWSPGERDYGEFSGRLERHLERLDAFGVEYRAATGPEPWQTRPGIPGRPSTREESDRFMADLTANIAD